MGCGGALGYEGPSLYLGASVGTAIQARRPKWFTRADSKVLMVAGAAAGVAAIFGPGTNIPSAAREILQLIRSARTREEV